MSVFSNIQCNKQASLLSPIKDPSDICSVAAFCRGERGERRTERKRKGGLSAIDLTAELGRC